MASALDRQTAFLGDYGSYRVEAHPQHARLYHITMGEPCLRAFFADTDVSVQELEYVPYMRFAVAQTLAQLLGASFKETIRGILTDRESGGFTIGAQKATTEPNHYLKFATAISYLVGPSNFDAMSGNYYARFEVKHTDESDSYLRQAYHTLTLHTDGTYVDEVTDWLLMMKFEERNAGGGESRFLHLDDWCELRAYAEHALAGYEYTYKSPPSKNVATTLKRRTFNMQAGHPTMCFIDQFVYPETIEQARYLKEMLESAERSPSTRAVRLPVGDLVMLNNHFWLHGREAFEEHKELHRELLRQRGYFSKDDE